VRDGAVAIRSGLTRRHFVGLLLPFGAAVLAACAEQGTPTGGPWVAYPAKDQWPRRFALAPPEVQEAYRFALANPEPLQYIPCYCGCGDQGHGSNRDCYIREMRPDGSVVLDPMSFG
jgi:hypothetical protein